MDVGRPGEYPCDPLAASVTGSMQPTLFADPVNNQSPNDFLGSMSISRRPLRSLTAMKAPAGWY